MKNDKDKIARFTPAERVNHWVLALTFILLALSGLVFFHPSFYFLNNLFGGGVWARILHPFIGIVMAISFAAMFFKFKGENVLTPGDREWLKHAREMFEGDDSHMPEAGKFNAGQKLLFWLLLLCMALLLLSGLIIWRRYFSNIFPVWMVRFASLLHAASGAGIIALIMGHIYLAIWTRESMGAMLYGYVRRAWARQHHPAWFRQVNGEEK